MRPGVSALSAEEIQAEKSKLEGNECFRRNRFQAAIDAYTEVFSIYIYVIFLFLCLLIFFFLFFLPRRLRCALKFLFIGLIVLYAIENASM